MKRSTNPKRFFSIEELEYIKDSIMDAERETTAEIRVHIEKSCPGDPKERAIKVFEEIGMNNTRYRNGCLVYLALKDKKLAIIGDKGINDKVSADFWKIIKEDMIDFFRKGKFTEGIVNAVKKMGEELKRYFPKSEDDPNELPDEVSFEKP